MLKNVLVALPLIAWFSSTASADPATLPKPYSVKIWIGKPRALSPDGPDRYPRATPGEGSDSWLFAMTVSNSGRTTPRILWLLFRFSGLMVFGLRRIKRSRAMSIGDAQG
ncbi:hypothetical protein [Phyllobacterium zundukense]|uniref:Uncharacterized protein n=1 Tax=Phyllobacterium zundukense TaxID=1867719 RepID=A0ACD4CWX8_9HYPH|nr:hypothetical protein [Phyllobacterium zundukense]UXN58117.1 hypothetical protein N8E88_04635 [Phyllobacterium zundukense]